MTDYDRVCAYGAQGIAGVEQRFAFLDAGSSRLHERGHRAQRFGGKLKRRSRACGGFVKQQHDALVAQQRSSLEGIHPSRQLQ